MTQDLFSASSKTLRLHFEKLTVPLFFLYLTV